MSNQQTKPFLKFPRTLYQGPGFSGFPSAFTICQIFAKKGAIYEHTYINFKTSQERVIYCSLFSTFDANIGQSIRI